MQQLEKYVVNCEKFSFNNCNFVCDNPKGFGVLMDNMCCFKFDVNMLYLVVLAALINTGMIMLHIICPLLRGGGGGGGGGRGRNVSAGAKTVTQTKFKM